MVKSGTHDSIVRDSECITDKISRMFVDQTQYVAAFVNTSSIDFEQSAHGSCRPKSALAMPNSAKTLSRGSVAVHVRVLRSEYVKFLLPCLMLRLLRSTGGRLGPM